MSGAVDLRSWLEERLPPERSVIARLWALSPELGASARALAAAMLHADVVRGMVVSLGQREREALQRVQSYGGSLAAPVLNREYGTIREAESYANPRAYLLALAAPPSPTERLYLLGLIQVLRDGAGASYAIPPDLLPLLPPVASASATLHLSSSATPAEVAGRSALALHHDLVVVLMLAQDGALAVTTGGGLNKASMQRVGRELQLDERLAGISREEQFLYYQFLRHIGEGAGLLRPGTDAVLRPTRAALEWMRLPLFERARQLLDGWIDSRFDELVLLCGMRFERAYGRDVARAKRALLRLIAQVPAAAWVELEPFVAAIKAAEPDYARPHGLYDTWGILNRLRMPLDGFNHWEHVEGEQIRAVVASSLNWLGVAELGLDDGEPLSFRLTPLGMALLQEAPVPDEPPEEPLVIQANFEVLVPPFASLYDRFQVARVAERTSRSDLAFYTLTKHSLQAALARGTAFEDIERFLVDASQRPLPQNVQATLREWASQHGQVSFRRAVLLETQDAALMQQLRHDKRLRFPHAERLTDTAWLVREGDAPQLAERLRKAGYGLGGESIQHETALSEHDMTVVVTALEFYAAVCADLNVEGDASSALRRRVARLLPEKQLHRAFLASRRALDALRRQLSEKVPG